MKRSIAALTFLLLSCGIFLYPVESPAKENYAVTGAVLDAAESFFISLNNKHYGAVWDMLSAESQKTIIDNILKASKKRGENLKKIDIKNDFDNKGAILRTYWDSFLSEFDPDMVLEESRWEMGSIDKESAEILILHKKSEHPAILRMLKENGAWKVGFWETFGTRKF